MEQISDTKKLKIVQLHLGSSSFREIASKTGVSVGTVANVIDDFKNGRMPHVHLTPEQIELIRELTTELKKLKLTPEQAAIGAALAGRLQEQGIQPSELGRCLDFWHRMASEDAAKDAIQSAFRLDDVCQRTGLTPEALVGKVELLEKEVARLEAVNKELGPKEKELRKLEERRVTLSAEVTKLDKERDQRQQNADRLEKREDALTARVTDWEERAVNSEERLAVAQRNTKQLAELGLSLDELAGFGQTVAVVAHKHNLKPAILRERLLSELEQLDTGLGLDSQVKTKKAELREVKTSIQIDLETRDHLRAEIEELRQQLAAIQGQVAADQAVLSQELQSYVSELKAAGGDIRQALSSTSSEVSAEVQRMKDQALEVGREIGRYDATIEQHQPMAILATLLSSQEEVKPQDVQFVSLLVLRRLRDWGKKHERLTLGLSFFVSHLESVITDLETWRP